MNEVKESLRSIEQKYKLFQQQQFTFIAALEHSRENAHDKIRPISSIGQVKPHKQGGEVCVDGWVGGRLECSSQLCPLSQNMEPWSSREEMCVLAGIGTQSSSLPDM